jgi:PKHD-type hydroxylase
MYRVLDILTADQVAELRSIAASATFVHGKVSNPHNKAKQNEQLHEQGAYQRSAKLILDAMSASPEFLEFVFPAQIAPPLLTRYGPGMHYGAHADAAYLTLPGGTMRSDISCTVFLNEPDSYQGGDFVELEQQVAAERVGHAALDEGNCDQPLTLGHGFDLVKRVRRVEHRLSRL